MPLDMIRELGRKLGLLAEIADEDDGKSDHHGGDSEKQHIPDVMARYALPFRDIGHNRWRLIGLSFEMVA